MIGDIRLAPVLSICKAMICEVSAKLARSVYEGEICIVLFGSRERGIGTIIAVSACPISTGEVLSKKLLEQFKDL